MMRSPCKRRQFVAAQTLVLTKTISLEGENRQHGHFRQIEPVPFKMKGKLGEGGFGQVHRVRVVNSTAVYALKKVFRTSTFSKQEPERFSSVITEIEVSKRLRHRHIIDYVGSYTHPRHIGLVISPIADMDLAKYLLQAGASKHKELRTFFSCLARGLEFLHDQRIRHKDIKPSNILVHRGTVLYTDFGLALDFAGGGSSTTVGEVMATTRQYCSPEVADSEPRNTASDIWSLGVVFLEMAAVLKRRSFQYVCNFLSGTGSRKPFPYANIGGVRTLIGLLKSVGDQLDSVALEWTQDMLKMEPHLRPTARDLS